MIADQIYRGEKLTLEGYRSELIARSFADKNIDGRSGVIRDFNRYLQSAPYDFQGQR
jgi:hypothetical protein